MSDKLCNKLIINYLQETEAVFICIRLLNSILSAHFVFKKNRKMSLY